MVVFMFRLKWIVDPLIHIVSFGRALRKNPTEIHKDGTNKSVNELNTGIYSETFSTLLNLYDEAFCEYN